MQCDYPFKTKEQQQKTQGKQPHFLGYFSPEPGEDGSCLWPTVIMTWRDKEGHRGNEATLKLPIYSGSVCFWTVLG